MIEFVSGEQARVGLPRIPRVVASAPGGASGPAGLWVGEGVPTRVPGARPEHEYLDSRTGWIYKLEADMVTWTPVANIKGPAGDTELSETERQAIVDRTQAETEAALEPPIDLTVLYTNAKI